MLDINNWNWQDPSPDLELAQIKLASARAMALLVRNRHRPSLQTHLMQIFGAIEMIEAIEYHQDAFKRIHQRFVRGTPINELHLRHEAVAYLNRLGQFVIFSRSDFARTIGNITAKDLPTMEGLMAFRNKYAAHRSIDAPRGDTQSLQHSHARAFSLTFGSLFTPRPNKRPPGTHQISNSYNFEKYRRQMWRASYLTFQIMVDEKNTFVNFTLEEQHPVIMQEAYGVIEKVILTDT